MYTIKQVSTMLSIPSVTIRAWEKRYGAVTPIRSDNGYRQYSPEDVVKLRRLKERMEETGMPISQAVLEQRNGQSPG